MLLTVQFCINKLSSPYLVELKSCFHFLLLLYTPTNRVMCWSSNRCCSSSHSLFPSRCLFFFYSLSCSWSKMSQHLCSSSSCWVCVLHSSYLCSASACWLASLCSASAWVLRIWNFKRSDVACLYSLSKLAPVPIPDLYQLWTVSHLHLNTWAGGGGGGGGSSSPSLSWSVYS